jgi:hypothetical protein
MPSQRPHRRILSLFAALLMSATAGAQTIDNKGTEFILAFIPNAGTQARDVEVHITADTATEARVRYPMNAPVFDSTVAVLPGAVTVVTLPGSAEVAWQPDVIQDNAVHITAGDEVVVYAVNRAVASSDAALALPVDALDTRYRVATYHPGLKNEFAVVAAFDNTMVTITPATFMIGRGVPFTITLNRGQGYFNHNRPAGIQDLTGTLIQANRPVTVTNGNDCVNVPFDVAACDHIFEIATPEQSWGMEVAVAGLPLRPAGTIYRIIPSLTGTTVTLDGVELPGPFFAGSFFETGPLAGNHVFRADAPILVVQFMPGARAEGPTARIGDPAMGNITPVAQYQRQYTFSTVDAAQFTQNFVSIIADNSDVGTLTLDGIAVPATEFTPIATSNLSVALVPIANGTHTTASAGGHGITVEGLGDFNSYLYPGGLELRRLSSIVDNDPPLCTLAVPSNGSVTGSASDSRASEDRNGNGVLDAGEDLNRNGVIDVDSGIFSVVLDSSENVRFTLMPFAVGAPSANFRVDLVDPSLHGSAGIVVGDRGGNFCYRTASLEPTALPRLACDVDLDRNVDRLDITAITAARNQPAADANDPRDADHSGTINVLDARMCTQLCTQAACAIL